MSRIGRLPIVIPSKVIVEKRGDTITVKGQKVELYQKINPMIDVVIKDNKLFVKRCNDEKKSRALHGLYRALIQNMIIGVSQGYRKELELVGVGYRVKNVGNLLDFSLGYTHNICLQLPNEISVETKSERNKNPIVILKSADKQLIGQVCAKIRSFRKVEPYKGKGIRFVGEVIRRKSGKSASKINKK